MHILHKLSQLHVKNEMVQIIICPTGELVSKLVVGAEKIEAVPPQ